MPLGLLVGIVVGSIMVWGSLGEASSGGGGDIATADSGLSAVPPTGRLVISRDLGADDRSLWAARGIAGFTARNSRQEFWVRFTRSKLVIHAHGGTVGLSLKAIGRRGVLRFVRPVELVRHTNEISYRHRGLLEWYANGPLGLEQGFRLTTALPRDHLRPVELVFALTGSLRARLDDEGVVFTNRRGRPILRYGGLSVSDATGRVLPSDLRLRGDQLIVDVEDAGARYPLTVDPLVQAAKLTASDGEAEDRFGTRVAVSGSTVVVGAPWATVGDNHEQGAVYVFNEPASGWANATETAKLVASGGSGGEKLGMSVAIDGSTIVAGGGSAVYVFSRPASGWRDGSQTAKLAVSGGGTLTFPTGATVAVHGSTVVAGEPLDDGVRGAAYVFVEPAGGWIDASQTATLTASDGLENELFGDSVAVSGSTIVVGAGSKIGAHNGQGAVYVFTEPPGGWVDATQTAKLTASDGAEEDFLGMAVAVSGSTIASSAPFATVNSNSGQGAVYVFTEPPGGWVDATQTAKLTVAEGASGETLGEEGLGISGSELTVGAPGAKVNSVDQGAVYVFDEPQGGWVSGTEAAELSASDGAAGDRLGWSVGVSGSTIVAGAPSAAVAANSLQGAAYVFTFGTPEPGSPVQEGSELEPSGSSSPVSSTAVVKGDSASASASPGGEAAVVRAGRSPSAGAGLSAATAPFTPLFATRAALRGSTLGLLVGVVGIEGVSAGERVRLRCVVGCARKLKDLVRVERAPHPDVRMTIAPPLVLRGTTTIELEGLLAGRVTRFVQYRFRHVDSGTIVAYAVRRGCLSPAGHLQSCPQVGS